MIELKSGYAVDFYAVKEYVEAHAKVGEKRNEAIETLHAIYLEAQENKTPISEIHEGSPKDYAKEIIEGLPHTSPEKKRKIRIALIVLASVAFVLAAFFTSDWYYMQKYGYNYYKKYPEIFWGAPHGGFEKEGYTAYISLGEDGYPTQDANLAAEGMYFESMGIPKSYDEFFTVIMRSETKQLSPTEYTVKYPGFTVGGGEYYWIHTNRDITAEVDGLLFEGEVTRVNATGKDLCYWIDFTASDENADYSGNSKRLKSGETVKIEFEDTLNMTWRYKGVIKTLLERHFPIFVSYKYDPVIEGRETTKEDDIYYYLTTSDGKAQAVVYTAYNHELGGQELIWNSIPRVLEESLDWAESGKPYLDDDGMICVEVTEVFKDGTIKTETVKAEKKTEFVYSEYTEYSENKVVEARVNAKRDEEGRFIEITGCGSGTTEFRYDENHNPVYELDHKDAEFTITEEGDIVAVVYYHRIDNREEILSETIFFNHKKY